MNNNEKTKSTQRNQLQVLEDIHREFERQRQSSDEISLPENSTTTDAKQLGCFNESDSIVHDSESNRSSKSGVKCNLCFSYAKANKPARPLRVVPYKQLLSDMSRVIHEYKDPTWIGKQIVELKSENGVKKQFIQNQNMRRRRLKHAGSMEPKAIAARELSNRASKLSRIKLNVGNTLHDRRLHQQNIKLTFNYVKNNK